MKPTTQPNVLWICSDQQRYDTIGATGNPHVHTPTFDRLCEEGIAFTKAYCQSPMCQPSRASFLTGLYPSRIHVNQNGQGLFPEGIPVISKRFAEHGYACGLAGKLHLASATGRTETRTDDGYGFFEYNHSPFRSIGNGNDYVGSLVSKGIELKEIFTVDEEGKYVNYKPDIPVEHHQTTWCVDKALEFIEQAGSQPWFLSLNIFDPHPPHNAPDEYKNRFDPDSLPKPLFQDSDIELQQKLMENVYHQTKELRIPNAQSQEERASYYGMIELLDEQIARIIQYLDNTGQKENTIIVFTSDHGEMLGDHGLVKKGCRFYEGAVRVPLIFSWKGCLKANVRCDAPVELLDIVPTLADLAGVPWELSQGESLRPILIGDAEKRTKNFVRSEYYQWENPYGEPLKPTFATMHYDGRYKLIVYHGQELGELYDLESDPNEFVNLWDDINVASIKLKLMKESFDQTILNSDPGSQIIAPH